MVNNTLHRVFVFILVLIVFVNAVVTVYIPAYQLLDAVEYDLKAYSIDLLNTFVLGRLVPNFEVHWIMFERIAAEVWRIVDEHPFFFAEYTGVFYLSVKGISFEKKNPNDSDYNHVYEITDSDWADTVKNFLRTLNSDRLSGESHSEICFSVTSDYIVFTGLRAVLVCTRDRQFPTEYITWYRNSWDRKQYDCYVDNVIPYMPGWYEIHTEAHAILNEEEK